MVRGPAKSVLGERRSILRGGRVGAWVVQCGDVVRSRVWGVRDHVATVYMEIMSWRWSRRAGLRKR